MERGSVVSGLVQSASGTWSGTTVAVSLATIPASTSTLVLIIAGNTTVTTPSGWTLRESRVDYMGHYLYTRTNVATTSWSVTTASGTGTWWLAEISHAAYEFSESANNPNIDVSYSTPFITPAAGERLLIASIGSTTELATARTISGWTEDFVEVDDICSATSDYPMQAIATRSASTDGTIAYGTTADYSGQSAGRSAIIASFVAMGEQQDTVPPTPPSGLSATPRDTTIELEWTASTDNVAVAGYEYSLDGGGYISTGSEVTQTAITGLDTATTYQIRIRAFDIAGNRSAPVLVEVETTSPVAMAVYQDFTSATWGAAASAKTSSDGVWRIAGDWPGTGGNMMLSANGTINFADPGVLSLVCQANSTNAAEIQTVTTYGHGYFECRMKVGRVAGTCQSFFLIGDGYGPGEIDFEFLTGGTLGGWLNDSTGTVMVNVHPTNAAVAVPLPFNPCDDFHVYGILWRTSRIDFVVDGQVLYTWDSLPTELGVGAEKMYVMANNWTAQSPDWGGGPPSVDAVAQYDYFKIWEGATTIPVGAVGGAPVAGGFRSPVNLAAVATDSSVALTWGNAYENAAGYEYSLDGTNFIGTGSLSTEYTVTGLTPGTAYTLRVRAVDAGGQRSRDERVIAVTTSATAGEIAGLARIPWEGGPAYYDAIPHAARAGWNDPSFIPVGLWWGGVSTQAQIQWDKDHGLNTYIITNSENPDMAALMEANGMHWIGGQLPGLNRDTSTCWVGDFLDDEVEGRFSPVDGRAHMQQLCDTLPDDNKLRFANWASMLVDNWFGSNDAALYTTYTDATSIDMYWYTVGFCSRNPYVGEEYFSQSIPQATCRTARSYGRMVDMLRSVYDRPNGRLQPTWNFLEVVSGAPAEVADPPIISPGQLKGAAMSSIIHEARGLLWFPQCFDGPYGAGNSVQSALNVPGYPGLPQVTAMGEINNFIHSLATVINTQSYVHNFGPGLDTMLKASGGYAYIFAMTEGLTGSRALTLPAGITGNSVEVIGESRTLSVDANRQFVDNFPNDYSYHVYKILI